MKPEKMPAGPGRARRNRALGEARLPGSSLRGRAKPQPCVVGVCRGIGPVSQTRAPRPTRPGPLLQREPRAETPDRERPPGRRSGLGRGPRAGESLGQRALAPRPQEPSVPCGHLSVATLAVSLQPPGCPPSVGTEAPGARPWPGVTRLVTAWVRAQPYLPPSPRSFHGDLLSVTLL